MGQNIIKLAKADYAENQKVYLLFIVLAILTAIGVLFFYCFNINDPRAFVNVESDIRIAEIKLRRFHSATSQLSIIYFIMIMAVFSKSFSHYFSKKRAVQTVLLPASKKEKFCYIAIRNVLLIPLFLIIVSYVNNTIWSSALGIIDYKFMNFGLSIWSMNILLFQGTFLTTFIFSSIYFKRYQFVFGWLTLFIAWMVYYFLISRWIVPYEESVVTSIVLPLLIIGMLYSVWWKYKNLQIK